MKHFSVPILSKDSCGILSPRVNPEDPRRNPFKYILLLFLAGFLVLILLGCGSTKSINHEPLTINHYDTLYLNKVQYDSIYKNDSFLMDYHPSKEYVYLFDSVLVLKVDTMYIHDRKVEYKYKYLRDTTYIHQVDTIPVIKTVEVIKTERYVPSIYKCSLVIVIILIITLILYIVWKIKF